jgi:Mg2+ and Co2+ transporter CorA
MIAGVFGMNLWNVEWLQASRPAFVYVIAVSLIGMTLLPAVVLLYMRRRNLTFVSEMT